VSLVYSRWEQLKEAKTDLPVQLDIYTQIPNDEARYRERDADYYVGPAEMMSVRKLACIELSAESTNRTLPDLLVYL
jgi:hypothetical protein